MPRLGPSAVSALAFAAVLAISSIGSSRILEKDEPELALRLFPLNVEAAMNGALAVLKRGGADEDLGSLETEARRLLPTHAGDARLYSLIGEARRRAGEEEQAYAAFEQAIALSKTEVTALQWTLQRAIEQEDYARALDQADILFRRWPARIAPLSPVIAGVFSDPARYPLLLEKLETAPPWRSSLINTLAREPRALGFLSRLVQDLAVGPSPAGSWEVGSVINALLAGGHYDLARRTFLFTLTPAQRAVTGYVHNGRFLLPVSGRPFDWQIRDHPGLTMEFPGIGGTGEGGLRLRFNNTPVRNLFVRQTLLLPAGAYSFSFDASAAGASLPKGLLWRIVCAGSNRVVAESAVAPGSYGPAPVTADLTIPPEACPAQTLLLATKAIGENWNDRYSGSVTFDNFQIVSVGS